ncbi:hypothetical protein D3C72_1015660 [compost metagenome]
MIPAYPVLFVPYFLSLGICLKHKGRGLSRIRIGITGNNDTAILSLSDRISVLKHTMVKFFLPFHSTLTTKFSQEDNIIRSFVGSPADKKLAVLGLYCL